MFLWLKERLVCLLPTPPRPRANWKSWFLICGGYWPTKISTRFRKSSCCASVLTMACTTCASLPCVRRKMPPAKPKKRHLRPTAMRMMNHGAWPGPHWRVARQCDRRRHCGRRPDGPRPSGMAGSETTPAADAGVDHRGGGAHGGGLDHAFVGGAGSFLGYPPSHAGGLVGRGRVDCGMGRDADVTGFRGSEGGEWLRPHAPRTRTGLA